MNSKKFKQKRGVGIVELIVFLSIMAMLGWIAHLHILGLFARARNASVKGNMLTLRIAAEEFATMAQGMYPETGTTTVAEVLVALGIPGVNNPSKIADFCPGTGANVSITDDALLPGNMSYVNPISPLAHSLDQLAAVPMPGPAMPPHVPNPPPGCSGAGTVYWGPVGISGAISMEGYVIYGDGYLQSISLHLRDWD